MGVIPILLAGALGKVFEEVAEGPTLTVKGHKIGSREKLLDGGLGQDERDSTGEVVISFDPVGHDPLLLLRPRKRHKARSLRERGDHLIPSGPPVRTLKV